MATADTAKLIAALELQDKFTKPLGGAERALGGFEKKMGALESSGRKFGQGLGRAAGTITKIAAGAAVAGIGVIAVSVKQGVDALEELESVTVATNTVLKSTKAVSGQTSDGIRDMAEGFEDLNATMDDKVIQSGANMLLTFTNVREKAFEPALEAALNMNEAMGGGPEGLQSTIIQVGKALNDPIKGVSALRRVGVQLSEDQEKQIKTLIEQNDLYGAQSIILDELTTQFGGRFAAAGTTAEGKAAALRDRIEDVQKALAGPLIPAIDRARDKLIEFLGSDRVIGGAEKLGEAIAGLFTDQNIDKGVGMVEGLIDKLTTGDFSGLTAGLGTIATEVGGLPWESIGNAAELLGTGAKAMLDTFTSMPAWVQTAVLTGWGLNKLTGGALGGIVGELGKGLIKGVLNMNAGVVNVNAGTVNGGTGGTGGAGGGAGRAGRLAGAAALAIGPLAIVTALGEELHRELAPIAHSFNELAGGKGASKVEVEGDLVRISQETGQTIDQLQTRAVPLLQSGERSWNDVANSLRTVTQKSDAQLQAQYDALAAARDLGPRIDRVANTPHNVQANVNNNITVPVYVSATLLQYKLTSLRTTTNSGGFI
jgi:hypothetical protein